MTLHFSDWAREIAVEEVGRSFAAAPFGNNVIDLADIAAAWSSSQAINGQILEQITTIPEHAAHGVPVGSDCERAVSKP
jgi:hypothetical protein